MENVVEKKLWFLYKIGFYWGLESLFKEHKFFEKKDTKYFPFSKEYIKKIHRKNITFIQKFADKKFEIKIKENRSFKN